MMHKKLLLVKMSSLGDLLHTMPAVTDALLNNPDLKVDWLCEAPFVNIARLHQGVSVIRHDRLHWKQHRLSPTTLKEQWAFYKDLRANKYDLVIDAQGRIKSARVGWLSGAPVHGLDKNSATDPVTSFYYKKSYSLSKHMNSVDRARQLFGQALGYQPSGLPDFGIKASHLAPCPSEYQGQLIFFHGTTWSSKHWPDSQWLELMALAKHQAQRVLLPWGNEREKERAEKLVVESGWGTVLPKMNLWDLSGVIAQSSGAVGVDTGLMHVAAAMMVPTVSIFGSTSIKLTGSQGRYVDNIQSNFQCSPCGMKECPVQVDGSPPCYTEISASLVWKQLESLKKENK